MRRCSSPTAKHSFCSARHFARSLNPASACRNGIRRDSRSRCIRRSCGYARIHEAIRRRSRADLAASASVSMTILGWRAMNDLNRRIKALCEAKGIEFMAWEVPPWEVRDNEPCPYPPRTGGGESWPKTLALRAKLKAELKAQAKKG